MRKAKNQCSRWCAHTCGRGCSLLHLKLMTSFTTWNCRFFTGVSKTVNKQWQIITGHTITVSNVHTQCLAVQQTWSQQCLPTSVNVQVCMWVCVCVICEQKHLKKLCNQRKKAKASNFSIKFESTQTSVDIYTSKLNICGCSQCFLSTKSVVLRYKTNQLLSRTTCW
jgi:hypothetical protein